MSSSEPKHKNRLADETSPYLLQHAHNPVDWFPWGDKALTRAKERDAPILLSIGYAACHWCHVMERESFENEDIAAQMNDGFVCIKVDREERPDLDEIYMAATVAMSGSGGWPMTVFLTPDEQKPFFAGTYFPPRDMHGRPGFPTLLRRITELWHTERGALTTQADELTRQLVHHEQPDAPSNVSVSAVDAAVMQLSSAFDATYGGFGKAPKFPPSMSLELLLRHHRRTGDEPALAMVRKTLDGMARGGMYDHLGGGFARYSTDDKWLVPHFEKMLYDNALLTRAYVHAYQVMGAPDDARVVRETLDYILREMTSPDGGFYSATDADSEGVEGKFFVWTPDEVEAVLPPDQARALCAYYDVTEVGNWEGNSILHTPREAAEVAEELGLEVQALMALLDEAKAKLYAARNDRVAPLCDDKILTAWNALMIGTMAECGRVLGEPRYREAAARAADFLLTRMRRPDGGLFRTTRLDKTHLDAYLEDYAFLTDALVDVYEAGCGVRYLEAARDLAERMVADFHDESGGGFFATAHDHAELIVRMRPGQDGAIPSANGIAATALTRLSWHLGREAWAQLAQDAVRTHGKMVERAPRAFSSSLCVLDMLLEGPTEVVVAGDAQALSDVVGRVYLPNRVIVHQREGEGVLAPSDLAQGKEAIDGAPTVYVCRDFTCRRPAQTEDDVLSALQGETERGIATRGKRLGKRTAGAATIEGTARYAKRVPMDASGFTELGSTALTAGRIGFGGYRVTDGMETFERALDKALSEGCNLIDTSTNYTDGGSERMIGGVLGNAFAKGTLQRDEVIVVSKIGYVQASNLALARQRQSEGRPFADMVTYADTCWHCIHPDFLADQLERSLDRLGLDTLDVVLLHNPEYFFSAAAKQGPVGEAERAVFYERVQRAFAYLESQVQAGRIGCYGVSSNSVAQDPQTDPEATELSRFWAAAVEAGGEGHHFRVLQLPVNLLESQGVLTANVTSQDAPQTVLAYAASKGLATLANRPLNAITENGMMRLATPTDAPAAPTESFASCLKALGVLEARFAAELLGRAGDDNPFVLAQQLEGIDDKVQSREQFEHIARAQVLPHVRAAITRTEQHLTSERHLWSEWRSAYIAQLEKTLGNLEAHTVARAAARAASVCERIDPLLPLARHGEPLQRKALWTMTSTEGLDVVLLGMRHPNYVADAVAVMAWPALAKSREVYEAMAKA